MPLVAPVVAPCCMLGLLEGFADQGCRTLTDQFVARGLFLLTIWPSAAGQPNGALSVDGRGKSEEAMDTGRGLLGSRSGNRDEGSSIFDPNILNARLLLASRFREGAGALPEEASPAGEFRDRKLGMTFQPDEKLMRRVLFVADSGSSVDRGNDWLCPYRRLPKAGPSSPDVLPRARAKVKMFPKPLEALGPLGSPNAFL